MNAKDVDNFEPTLDEEYDVEGDNEEDNVAEDEATTEVSKNE